MIKELAHVPKEVIEDQRIEHESSEYARIKGHKATLPPEGCFHASIKTEKTIAFNYLTDNIHWPCICTVLILKPTKR